jgi:hypothetical protein
VRLPSPVRINQKPAARTTPTIPHRCLLEVANAAAPGHSSSRWTGPITTPRRSARSAARAPGTPSPPSPKAPGPSSSTRARSGMTSWAHGPPRTPLNAEENGREIVLTFGLEEAPASRMTPHELHGRTDLAPRPRSPWPARAPTCQICRRTVAYRPGTLSQALTEHYRRAHPEALSLPAVTVARRTPHHPSQPPPPGLPSPWAEPKIPKATRRRPIVSGPHQGPPSSSAQASTGYHQFSPAEQRAWRDEPVRAQPGWQQPSRRRHRRAVGPVGLGPRDLAPQHPSTDTSCRSIMISASLAACLRQGGGATRAA